MNRQKLSTETSTDTLIMVVCKLFVNTRKAIQLKTKTCAQLRSSSPFTIPVKATFCICRLHVFCCKITVPINNKNLVAVHEESQQQRDRVVPPSQVNLLKIFD